MALKDYYRSIEKVLTGQDEKDRFPTREDLGSGKIYIDWESCSRVQSLLNKYRYCLVEGAERRGKTTLVRLVGFQYLANRQIFRVDIGQVEDAKDLAEFTRMLEDGSLDRSDTLIIIEDCHLNPEVTERLLNKAEDCTQASFLFTLRTIKQRQGIPVEDPFEDSVIRENNLVVCLDDNKETIYNNIKGIVDKFVENNKNELMRKSKPAPIHEDYQYMVAQTGGNKRILNYYLQAWCHAEGSGLPLRKTDRKLVLVQFYKERLKGLSTASLETLKSMSVLGQFEIPIFIKPLFPHDYFDAAQEVSRLKENGLAFRQSRQDQWLLADTESILTLECLGASDFFICSILSTYIQGAPNYYEVFASLLRAHQRNFINLLANDRDVFNSLVSRLSNANTTMSEMLYVLRSIAWADKTKALDLWHKYKEQAGEQFFDEVQRKLSEHHDIRITTILLTVLRNIDREGEAVPLADALAIEPLISQVQAELSSFNYVSVFITRLHTLARKKANQVMNSLNESDYKRLGEKARNKNSQQIMWFFRLLAVHTVSEAKSEAFIEGLGIDFPSRTFISSAISITSTTLRLLEATAPQKAKQVFTSLNESDFRSLGEKARKIKNPRQALWFINLLMSHQQLKKFVEPFLSALGRDEFDNMIITSTVDDINQYFKLDPERVRQVLKGLNDVHFRKLGEEAGKGKNLQQVFWFIRLLASDEQLKRFAGPFLQAIGQDKLNRMASESPLSITRSLRKKLNKINTDTAIKIGGNLIPDFSEEEWIERWTSEPIGPQSWRLWGWARSLDPQLRERGRKLARRLASADTALHYGEVKGKALVENLEYLLSGAYYLDEEAAKGLALKAVNIVDIESMKYSLQDLVYLLRESIWCNRDAAQQLVDKIFSCDADYLSSKGEINWFCRLLWLSVLSNEGRTEKWVNEVSESFWEDLVVNTSRSNAFHLLIVLYQINNELGRRVTHAVDQRLLTSPKLMDDSQAMALLGLLAFCDVKHQVAFSFSPTEKATELCIYPTNQRLAFSLLCLQESKPEAIPGFIKACLTTGVTAIGITLLLAEYPLPWTASTMEKLLVSAKSESQIPREDVYDRMILLFRTTTSRQIYLNNLLNKMCTPQFAPFHELTPESDGSTEQEQQKARSWATLRLGKAIDKGIFIVQDTEHPITHIASRLLNLDLGHPEVAFALNITKDLLIALSNTQRVEGWTDINTWDAKFIGNWKGEPLAQQRIRYWQGILIKMDMVKVDYKETDRGNWAMSFGINTDHPLVKSFIKA